MALSTLKTRYGPVWPLGFVTVANNGTPVCLMNRIDANNVNAPGSSSNNQTAEYSLMCRSITLQGYKPGSNNNGMVINTGNVYVMMSPANNGSGNRTDSGAMVKVLYPGADYTIGGTAFSDAMFSPYQYYLDSDVDGEGALTTLLQPMGQ